jgi:hypothetical protein
MKHLFLLVLTAFSTVTTFAQPKHLEIIEDRLLTWDDFKGRHQSDAFDAFTFTFINIEPRKVNPTDPIPNYKAICFFSSKESTVSKEFLKSRPDSIKKHVLNHEQGHYDLARIATAEMNSILAKFNYNQRRSVYQADSIFRSINNKLRATQLLYDKETNHSKVYQEQQKWDALIAEGIRKGKLPV